MASRLIGVDEVATRLGVSKGTAYRVIRDLNEEMSRSGKKTIPGKVDEAVLEYRYFADMVERGDDGRKARG